MLVCILGGIGTAGVPAGSLPVVALILGMIGVPPEGIGLVLGVDRFLDMCRTTLNVTGDLTLATIVSRGEPHDGRAGRSTTRLAPPPRRCDADARRARRALFDDPVRHLGRDPRRRARSSRRGRAAAAHGSATGKTIILVTNAPRPASTVQRRPRPARPAARRL